MTWLRLELMAPMASFGGPAIDAFGRTNDMPGRSMMTGLLANALGWDRNERDKHQRLQDRLVYASALVKDGDDGLLTDYQTADLRKDDKAWTTTGRPARRTSNADTFTGSHQRWRDYHTDMRMTVVLTLIPHGEKPTLADVTEALERPARPLVIGRASCLPSRRMITGHVDADTALAAITKAVQGTPGPVTVHYPAPGRSTTAAAGHRLIGATDERNWRSGLHGGERMLYTGRLETGAAP